MVGEERSENHDARVGGPQDTANDLEWSARRPPVIARRSVDAPLAMPWL
jgi:hypothetical protein